MFPINIRSQFTSTGDGRRLVFWLSRIAANSLNCLDNFHRLLVGNFSKDNMLSVEPRGNNSGDEELRSIAAEILAFVESEE